MRAFILPLIAVVCAGVALSFSLAAPAQDQAAMQEMMQQAARFTQPGEAHKLLERFVGKWQTQTRFFMGDQPSPAEAGSAEWKWMMSGRWLQSHSQGKFMGQAVEQFYLLGYDNFKKSYVATGITSIDTAMNRFEGDATQDGKSLICYGTMDEYLTGEHDKLVKYAFRFLDADTIVLEVHDLGIGEQNAKVVEVSYTRSK